MNRLNVFSKYRLSANKIYFLFASIFIILFLLISFLREPIYFRDFAIIFDGVLRLKSGLGLYSDFGVPVGPVAFYGTYALLNIFSFSYYGMLYAQIFLSIAILLVFNFILFRAAISCRAKVVANFFFIFFYLTFLINPWYNTWAALFLIAGAGLLLIGSNPAFFLSGVSASLALLSKQDFGVLLLLSSTAYILFYKVSVKSFPDVLTKPLSYYFLGAIVTFLLIISFFDIKDFFYWVSFFQANRAIPINRIYELVFSPTFYLALVALLYSLRLHHAVLSVISLVIFISSVTMITSGFKVTSYYYVGFIVLLLSILYNENANRRILGVIVALSVVSVSAPVGRFVLLLEGLAYSDYEHYSFNYRNIDYTQSDIIHLGECNALLKGAYGPVDMCDIVYDIAKISKSRKLLTVLNVSELTYISHSLDLRTPDNLPLWYHTKVSLFSDEHNRILKLIDEGKIDIIVAQPSLYIGMEVIRRIKSTAHYAQFAREYVTPMSITNKSSSRDNNALVFYRIAPLNKTGIKNIHDDQVFIQEFENCSSRGFYSLASIR